MSTENYSKAYKQGKKFYRADLVRGQSPYLPALEQILEGKTIVSQEKLGVIDIPLEQIVGTYYEGRQPAFGRDFLPLMPEDSEFAQKWAALCQAQMADGIRDPIKAREYQNRFYVIEGHKRVSVLKHFGAGSVRGDVTRIITEPEDTLESRIYQEFLRFYRITGINYLWFSREGGFDSLLKAVGFPEGESWDAYERATFRSLYTRFSQAFAEKSSPQMKQTPADALLIYLDIYSYASSVDKTLAVIRTELGRIWNEISNRESGSVINLVLKPEASKSLFSQRPDGLRVAFIHCKTAATSSWVYAHELGRRDLEAAFDGRIETISLESADNEEAVAKALEAAIADESDLIFTTSPQLLNASVKAALNHPKARILNCSLNTSHPSVRTYYARMYEAKFLMGVIAGCLSPDGNIGYIADYPIYGIIANINAFALGAKMVNPRAMIYLEWSKTVNETDGDSRLRLYRSGISYISDRDMIAADDSVPHHVGLYHSDGKTLNNTALSFLHWGRLYTKIVRNYLSGGWKASDKRAINYWWGMESGVIDLICSRSLPEGTARLVNLLADSIRDGSFYPFAGRIRTQDGTVRHDTDHPVLPEEIITMEWLADNVIGSLPAYDQLLPEAQALVRIQGVRKI